MNYLTIALEQGIEHIELIEELKILGLVFPAKSIEKVNIVVFIG